MLRYDDQNLFEFNKLKSLKVMKSKDENCVNGGKDVGEDGSEGIGDCDDKVFLMVIMVVRMILVGIAKRLND